MDEDMLIFLGFQEPEDNDVRVIQSSEWQEEQEEIEFKSTWLKALVPENEPPERRQDEQEKYYS